MLPAVRFVIADLREAHNGFLQQEFCVAGKPKIFKGMSSRRLYCRHMMKDGLISLCRVRG